MQLAVRLLSLIMLAGALLAPSLRWRRSAFASFVLLSLASFAFRAGWPAKPLNPAACEGLVGPALAMHSFRNTPHIVLFALCFLLARMQFSRVRVGGHAGRWTNAGALAITLIVGALVELAEGASGAGHCRLRDMLPDGAGALLGWAAIAAFAAARQRWWRSRSATLTAM